MQRIVRKKQRRAGENRAKLAFQNECQYALSRSMAPSTERGGIMTECSDQEEEDPQDCNGPLRRDLRRLVEKGGKQHHRGCYEQDRAHALQHPSPALGLLGEVQAEPEVEQAGEQEVDVVGAKQGADRLVGLIEAGEPPFRVKARQQKDDDRDDAANLSSLWLSVELFEHQVAWIHERTSAEVTFTYFPGETFRGTVRFIEPEFSEKTRTLRVKLEVPNPGRRLRSGMFATVTFEPVAARGAITVPSLAVLRTGQRNVVVLDLGEGRFAPRAVTLGHQGGEYVEVLEGLEEGDRVVTSAQFLIDSEASLQAVIQKMIAQRMEAPSGPREGGHAQ